MVHKSCIFLLKRQVAKIINTITRTLIIYFPFWGIAYALIVEISFHGFTPFFVIDTELDNRITRGVHAAFASRERLLYRAPGSVPLFWDLVGLQFLIPDFLNLPCLYSTFHLEYPSVLFRFCLHLGNDIQYSLYQTLDILDEDFWYFMQGPVDTTLTLNLKIDAIAQEKTTHECRHWLEIRYTLIGQTGARFVFDLLCSVMELAKVALSAYSQSFQQFLNFQPRQPSKNKLFRLCVFWGFSERTPSLWRHIVISPV